MIGSYFCPNQRFLSGDWTPGLQCSGIRFASVIAEDPVVWDRGGWEGDQGRGFDSEVIWPSLPLLYS